MLIVTNIAQFLEPLLSGHPVLSGHLRRSRRCPLNRGFTVFVKLLIQLVREFSQLSGKSRGISETSGFGNHA